MSRHSLTEAVSAAPAPAARPWACSAAMACTSASTELHVVATGTVWLLCPRCQTRTTINTMPAPRKVPSCPS